MNRILATLVFLLALAACDMLQPEETLIEVWSGIAEPVPFAPVAADVGVGADSASVDTTRVVVRHEREVLSDIVYATFTIWETDPSPCGIPWLKDDDPCFYMTAGEGIGVPFLSPEGRVIRFEMPKERCELAGPIREGTWPDPDEWIAFLRCGEHGEIRYAITLTED